MAQRSGLFDSTEIVETIDGYPRGNRAETADFFAKYFSNFIDNGVFTEASTSFQVLTAGGMNVTVKKGSCFINGYMAFDDEDEVFTLTAGHTHWFVQRAHLITGGDITKTWIVDAAEGELPLRDGVYYDLLIAKVVIPAGTNSITDEMITDYRYDKTVCGAVTSLKPAVVPTLPDDVLKYVSNSMFQTVGGTSIPYIRIATGTYTGTGTLSVTLASTFKPMFIGVYMEDKDNVTNDTDIILCTGNRGAVIKTTRVTASTAISVSYANNSVTLTNTASYGSSVTTATKAGDMLNTTGNICHYVFIG